MMWGWEAVCSVSQALQDRQQHYYTCNQINIWTDLTGISAFLILLCVKYATNILSVSCVDRYKKLICLNPLYFLKIQ